jgi:hypothetical protein
MFKKLFSKKEVLKEFPSKITINKKEIPIKIIFINKKNASVILKNNSLEFRFPKLISNYQIKKTFYQLLENITKKIEKKPSLIENYENMIQKLKEKKYFYFNNQKFNIEFKQTKRFSYSKLNNKILIPNDIKDIEIIEKYITKILIKNFSDYLINYIFDLNKKTYNYPIKNIVIKSSKSKWGHCTSKNEIMLNIKLLNGTKEQLDYVIFHEISHIKYKNHSKEFWLEVSKFCPNYKQIKKTFKENSPKIFKF